MKTILTSLLLLVGLSLAQAQASFLPGDILVKLKAKQTPNAIINQFQVFNGEATSLRAAERLSEPMNIWLFHYDNPRINEKDLMREIGRLPQVEIVQLNYKHELRNTVPNDPQYNQQWQYDNNGASNGVADADIDMPEAWDIATGGLTALGDTIVVCVVDDGCNLNHPDLQGNLWRNYAEIPGNGIDDDNNGYVDDYLGWNSTSNTDAVGTGGSHGTCVTGIIGAKGNNGIGVSGVNWDVKLMIVKGGGQTSATAVAAYSYPYTMRRLYNQTNGVKGAFVVATNSSWGVDGGQPADEPLWCAFYDSLGRVGILNAGAGPNLGVDVDTYGDLPSACPSDYLVTLTNMRRNDTKEPQAGWGLTTIDLGAFGTDTWTLTQNSYGPFGGTSGATPHVAGTIGLMYSAPCPGFIQLAKADPAQAALMIKQWILAGVDPLAVLNGQTVTGGRLNTFNAMTNLMNNCPAANGCFQPYGMQLTTRTDTSMDLVWTSLDTSATFNYRYRAVGDTTWLVGTSTLAQLSVNGLTACTSYEFQLQSICDTTNSVFSGSFTFRTDGCCEPPQSSSASASGTTATIEWQPVLAASAYNVHYRPFGTTAWTELTNLTGTTTLVSGLEDCTTYEYQVQTACSGGLTPYGALGSFQTGNCPECVTRTYCELTPPNTQDEWIESVSFTGTDAAGAPFTYQLQSGDNGGYLFVTNTGGLNLNGLETFSMTLTPGYTGTAYNEVFRVWIDFDHSGTFDNSESVYVSPSTQTAVNTTIVLPNPLTGSTRMRVTMRYQFQAQNCADFNYGEVEDFCIHTTTSVGVNNTPAAQHLSVQPNPFSEGRFTFSLPNVTDASAELVNLAGQVVATRQFQSVSVAEWTGLEQLPTGIYMLRIQTNEGTWIEKVLKN